MSSVTFSQAKLNGENRCKVIEATQTQMQAVVLAALHPLFSEFLRLEVTAKLGRAKGELRAVTQEIRSIDWQLFERRHNPAGLLQGREFDKTQ
jgi:hypothetical protein